MSKPKIIDLFSGVGGFSLGFEMAGYESVFATDFWEDAIETYNKNRGKEIAKHMDIAKLTNEKLKELKSKHDIEGIIGGPPCQGFSMAGARIRKNNFIDDPRNYLFKYYFKIVQQVRPKVFILENVKGILNKIMVAILYIPGKIATKLRIRDNK